MNSTIRILIVEDNPNDFDLAQREIRKVLDDCEITRVETEEEYLAALASRQPDVILCDYSLPKFDGMKALKLAQEHAILTPFIIWTGSLSEEVAAQCMQAGANNYILKENITRLGPAVLHALEERQLLLQHKEAEDKLRKSESNYRMLAENSLQGIAIFQKQRFVYANPALCMITGYTADELLALSEDQILAQTHPDDRAIARDRVMRRRSSETVSPFNDLRIIRKNGDIRWIQTSANSIEYDGQPAILSTSIDITERKQAEGKYQTVYENSPVGIFQSTPQGQYINVNPAMAHIYGYDSPEEMINSVNDIAGQVYLKPEERRTFRRSLETQGTVENFEFKNVRKDGGIFWASTSARVVRDQDGTVLYYEGFLQDITARKEADERLIESEKRFRSLIANGMDNISLLAEDGTLVWEDPSTNFVLGYERGRFVGESILQLLHPDDAERINQLFAKLVQERGGLQEATFRFKHQDGTWRWIEAKATNMLDEPSVKAIVLNYRDVSERKNAEARINDLLSWNEKILNHTPLGILAYKLTGECTFANERAAAIVGTTIENLRAQNFHHLETWKKSGLYALVEKAISTKTLVSGDIHHISTFGKESWMSILCVLFKMNEEEHLLLSVTDIIERKRAEEALRENEQRYRSLFEDMPIAIWEEDFSEVKKQLDALKAQGVTDFRAYFTSHPEELARCTDPVKILNVNNKAVEMYHAKDKQELIDSTLQQDSTGEKANNIEDLIAIAEGRTSHSWEGGDETSDGIPLEIRLSWSVIPGHEEDYSKVIVTTIDITESRRVEKAEREQRALAEALRDTAQQLSSTLDYGEVLDHILAAVERVVPHSAATIMLIEGEFAHVVRSHGYDKLDVQDAILGIRFPVAKTNNLRQMLEMRKPVIVHNAQTYTGWKRLEFTDWVRSNVGAPISIQGEVIGFILLDSETPGFFTPLHAERLEAFANQAALAIHNARLLHQAKDEIAERKRTEIELQQKNDDLRLLNTVNNAIVRGQNLDSIVDLLTVELKRIFSAAGSTIYMLAADKRSLTMQHYSFSPEMERRIEKLLGFKVPKIQIPVKEGGHFHNALITKQSAITSDPQKIEQWIAEFAETRVLPSIARTAARKLIHHIYKLLNIKSTIIVPLISHDEVIGFLDVSSSGMFTRNDLKRIENIGEQLTSLIQRQQANEQLHKSEEFLQGVQNSLSAHMAILDESGTIVQVNEAWRRFGEQNGLLSADYCVGMNYIATCETATGRDVDVATEMAVAIRQILAGKRDDASFEYACHSPTEKRWFTVHITRFDDGKQKWGILAHEDITTRKAAEIALGERTAQFRTLFEASPDAIVLIDPTGGWPIVDCNSAAASMNGYTREELIGKSIDVLNPRSEQGTPESRSAYLESIKNTEVLRYEAIHIHRDGTPMVIEVSTTLIQLGGRDMVLGIDRDITERKRTENELRASEERFRQLANNIQEVFWITDAINGEEIYVSPAAEKIWGRQTDILLSEPSAFIESILPEDRPEVIRMLDQQRNGTNTDMEYRVTWPDGSVHWIWDRAFPIFDETGRVVRLAGIAADVTERKQTEIALLQSQARYHDLFDNSPISLWEEDFSLVKKRIESLQQNGVTDLDEYLSAHPEVTLELSSLVKIIDINRVSLQLYHVRRKEELLKSLTEFISDETLQQFRHEIMGLINTARFEWEGKDRTVDGRELMVMVNGSISPGYEEDWSKVIVSISDITERKQTEDALRESEEQFSSALEFAPIGMALVSPDRRWIKVNRALCELVGYTEPEMMTMTFQEITHPEDLDADLHYVEQMLRSEINSYEIEKRYLHKSGKFVWALLSVSLVKDQEGKPRNFIAQIQDITQRKQANLEFERHVAELEALYENGLAVGRLLEPKEIGSHIIQTFARYLSWHHVVIRLLNPETDKLELIAFNQPDLSDETRLEIESRFNTMVSNVGQGLSGLAMQTGSSIRTGNVHTHPQYVDTHEGIQSGLYMPLKLGDRLIGCISVESGLTDAFTPQDERLLATLANQAAIAFENARLYQTAQLELSERRRAQEALHVSETHYRQLADSITDILFELDQNLRYTHWNKASEMFSGIPEEDAIGRSIGDTFGNSHEQLQREEIYRVVLQERQARIFETAVIAKGQKRYLEISAYPSATGVSVVAKDITERRLTDVLLQKRFQLMEFAAQHSLEDVMQRTIDEVSELTESHVGFLHFVDEDQKTIRFQAWSSETLRLMKEVDETGMHYPLDSAGPWADAVRQRRSIIYNDYGSLPDKQGLPEEHVSVIREMVVPIIRNESIAAILGVGNKAQDYTSHDLELVERFTDYAWDIAERKQMENTLAEERKQLAQRVEERTADLSRANSNLARALRVKDEFLANMSHELRTPLNAILGLSESLGEQVAGPLNEKQQKYLSTINESGHHLLSLINDILDLAKIEAGQISLDINKVDVNSVCQASLRMIKQLAQRKNQDVHFEIEPGIGLMWADERRLKQMMVNLLSNAVKFTPDSGALGLQVRGDQEGNKISFTVWDRGIGIGNNDIERLFKPFVQLDAGLAREAAGTGLGLALVSQMAKLHGGSVTVESQTGQGSRFTIMLPWEPALGGESNSRLRSTGKFRAIKLNEIRPTILLIEDTREVVMMLVDYLEMAGFNMVTAQDGVDGLTQAKIAHPDLILMDIQMPRMDGFETTIKLRSDPEFKETPIIALTALAMPNDRQRCLDVGMNEYLSKPVNLKALVKTIKLFLYEAETDQL